MNCGRIFIASLLLLASGAVPLHAIDIHVRAGAVGGDGSLASPFGTITSATALAASTPAVPDTIKITGGVFKEGAAIDIPPLTTYEGGYLNDFSSRVTTLQEFAVTSSVTIANFGMETPVQTNSADGESNGNLGAFPGWTITYEQNPPGSLSRGVSNPAFWMFNGASPLPAPFEGNQFAYINLNNDNTIARLDSDPIGTLTAGQKLALRVSLGARNFAGWANVSYEIWLVSQDGTQLGTTKTLTLDPGTAATNIVELETIVDVDTQAAAKIGQTYFARIRAENVLGGPSPNDFTQTAIDNVRVGVVLGNGATVVSRDDGITTHQLFVAEGDDGFALDSLILDNGITGVGDSGRGGGLEVSGGGSGTVNNCIFRGCEADGNGGRADDGAAIWVDATGASLTVTNSIFENCIADNEAIVRADDGTLIIDACIFRDNVASPRIVEARDTSTDVLTITNSLFYRNTTSEGLVYSRADNFTFRHNTITSNSLTNSTDGLIYLQPSGTTTADIQNNIIANNVNKHGTSQGVIRQNTAYTTQNIANNLIYNNEGFTLVDPGTVVMTGTILADPLFNDPINGDYRPGFASSPAIAAGVNAGVVTDLEGNVRGVTPDLGAYEVADPNLIYVDVAAAPGGNGTQGAPFNNLTSATQQAAASGGSDRILIAEGTYSPAATIALPSNTGLEGGYNATTWLQNGAATIVDAASARQVFTANNAKLFGLENITLLNGRTASGNNGRGGGLGVWNGSTGVVANCIFDNCDAPGGTGSGDDGAALRVINSNVRVSGCLFENCDAADQGVIYTEVGNLILENSIIRNNSTAAGNDNAFMHGTSDSAPLMQVVNNLFYNNTAGDELLYIRAQRSTVAFNTITSNTLLSGANSGLIRLDVPNEQSFTMFLLNNIVADNRTLTGVQVVIDEQANANTIIENNVFFNNLGFSAVGAGINFLLASTNYNLDPEFANPLAANFVPQGHSPAHGRAAYVPGVPVATDINGYPRGINADIGAYESNLVPVELSSFQID